MTTKKSNLWGSAPSIDSITKLISKFYMGSTITLIPNENETEYEVHNKNGLINTVKVIKKGKRFRFESK